MKKVNGGYIAMQFVKAIVIALVIGVAGWIALSVYFGGFSVPALKFFAIAAVIVGLIVKALMLSWGGSGKKSKKTFDEGLEQHNFKDISTFKTSNAYLAIDGSDGRVAYVSNHNPMEFQVAEVSDLSKIKTDMMRGPLGGASAVFFSFVYRGQRTKVYTFLSNRAFSLKSGEILEATAKADMYVDLLKGMQAGAANV